MATRIGFEPTIFGLTGQYVNRYTTGPRPMPSDGCRLAFRVYDFSKLVAREPEVERMLLP